MFLARYLTFFYRSHAHYKLISAAGRCRPLQLDGLAPASHAQFDVVAVALAGTRGELRRRPDVFEKI